MSGDLEKVMVKTRMPGIMVDARQTMGGVERYTSELVRLASREEYRSRFVFFGRGPLDLFTPVSPRRNAGGYFRHVLGNGKRVLTDQLLMPLAARRTGAVLIHSPNYLVPLFTDRPVVVTCHDTSLADHFSTKQAGVMRYYERAVMRNGLQKAAHIIVPSRAVAARLVEKFHLSPERVSVIYPPLPSFCFEIGNGRKKSEAASFWGSRPFFLSVGTLEPRKNLRRLLQGWRLAYSRSRIPLLLVGPYGWGEKRLLDEQFTVSDGLQWLGPVDDPTLASLYRQAAAVIQYSLDEGFGYPVAEALCAGTPLVLSDIEVHREVAADCALFAPPSDPKVLADRLVELCSWTAAKRLEIEQRSLKQAELIKRFSTMESYLTVYEDVLALGTKGV